MATKLNVFPLLAMLFVAFFALVLVLPHMTSSPSFDLDLAPASVQPSMAIDFNTMETLSTLPTSLEQALAATGTGYGLVLSSASTQDHSGWQQLNLEGPGFNLPKPPDKGKKAVEDHTGKEVKLEVYADEYGNVVDMLWKSGNRVAGSARLFKVPLAALGKDMLDTMVAGGQVNGVKHIWIATIETATGLGGLGIGRYMFELTNAVAKLMNGNQPVMRVFCDQAGWGPTLLKGVEVIQQIDSVYLYWVK